MVSSQHSTGTVPDKTEDYLLCAAWSADTPIYPTCLEHSTLNIGRDAIRPRRMRRTVTPYHYDTIIMSIAAERC